MPEKPEKNPASNQGSEDVLGPVNIGADAWTSSAGTVYILTPPNVTHRGPKLPFTGSRHRTLRDHPESFIAVDNASYWILSQVSPTRWMSGVRCWAHLASMLVQSQDLQLRLWREQPHWLQVTLSRLASTCKSHQVTRVTRLDSVKIDFKSRLGRPESQVAATLLVMDGRQAFVTLKDRHFSH
ncbi:hypothetical protein B0H19DRAFT_1083907 [Mycena capillaripes]|nr:hypothetical protein B0H19DRAFT_1083907 [Mycena capillaripes]